MIGAMTGTEHKRAADAAWADYWEQDGGAEASVQAVRGDHHAERLTVFWKNALRAALQRRSAVRLLDAACGAGIVGRTAAELAEEMGTCDLTGHCTDYSHAAVRAAMSAGSGPRLATAADARALPYEDGSFDLVVSQFGLEYAGDDGFREAARVVAAHGQFLAVIHMIDGGIHEECSGNLRILDAIEQSGLMRMYGRVLELAERVDAGRAAPGALSRPTRLIEAARLRVCEALSGAPPGAAADHALRLMADWTQLFERRGHYGAGVAQAWISAQAAELDAFARRMRSMLAAARDLDSINALSEVFRGAGLSTVEVDTLVLGDAGQPAAWVMSASAP